MFENFKARAENSGNTEVKRFATTAGSEYTCSNYSLEKES
jgi:hypothetical protein